MLFNTITAKLAIQS